MSRYRIRPDEVEASQWDPAHGLQHDAVKPLHAKTRNLPDGLFDSSAICRKCGATSASHGWVETARTEHVVCPGDWVVEAGGDFFPVADKEFHLFYEPVLPFDNLGCIAKGEPYLPKPGPLDNEHHAE